MGMWVWEVLGLGYSMGRAQALVWTAAQTILAMVTDTAYFRLPDNAVSVQFSANKTKISQNHLLSVPGEAAVQVGMQEAAPARWEGPSHRMGQLQGAHCSASCLGPGSSARFHKTENL